MSRFRLRTVLIALLALVAIGGLISRVPNLNLGFYSSKDCSVQSTTLVVDFGTGSTPQSSLRCASNFTGTGWQLFAATGFHVEGTSQYPTGFVCRIEQVPSPRQDACLNTPDNKNGHWAYFYSTASTGNTWHFSPIGAATRKPKCGDWDGWRYLLPGEDAASNPPRQEPSPYSCK